MFLRVNRRFVMAIASGLLLFSCSSNDEAKTADAAIVDSAAADSETGDASVNQDARQGDATTGDTPLERAHLQQGPIAYSTVKATWGEVTMPKAFVTDETSANTTSMSTDSREFMWADENDPAPLHQEWSPPPSAILSGELTFFSDVVSVKGTVNGSVGTGLTAELVVSDAAHDQKRTVSLQGIPYGANWYSLLLQVLGNELSAGDQNLSTKETTVAGNDSLEFELYVEKQSAMFTKFVFDASIVEGGETTKIYAERAESGTWTLWVL